MLLTGRLVAVAVARLVRFFCFFFGASAIKGTMESEVSGEERVIDWEASRVD